MTFGSDPRPLFHTGDRGIVWNAVKDRIFLSVQVERKDGIFQCPVFCRTFSRYDEDMFSQFPKKPCIFFDAVFTADDAEAWKAAGIKVIPVVASVAYALKMQECGADAVVAEGAESGGHVGDNHTMALVPQIVDALDIPVLAAGGIFDGRGAAAAFMLGACGVQVGTRFLMADECHIHDNYKEKLIKASDVSTMVTGKSMGDAVRCLKTPFSKKFFKMEYDPEVPKEEVLKFGTGSLRKAVFDGDNAGGSFLAGEVAGMITKRETVAQIVEDIMGGAERLLSAAPELIAR